MDDERVVIISMDNFYRPLTADERANVDGVPCSDVCLDRSQPIYLQVVGGDRQLYLNLLA